MGMPRASTIAVAGFTIAGCALLVLHVLPTGMDPTVNFVSEYAIGPYGWIARLVGFPLAIAFLALVPALGASGLTPPGSALSNLLGVVAGTLIIGQLFPVDPVEAAFAGEGLPDFSATGWIHVIAGQVSAATTVVAMVVVTAGLRRRRVLDGAFVLLPLFAGLAALAFVASFAQRPATYPAGLVQRAWILSMLGFFILLSGSLVRGWQVAPGGEGGPTGT